MKKSIFLLLAIVAMAVTIPTQAQAQVKVIVDDTSSYTADTITNNGSSRFSFNLKPGYDAAMTIQVVVNKISGTAAGTAVVYGAISKTTGTGGDTVCYVSTGDTLTVTNTAVSSRVFNYSTGQYTHYRVVITGSGTMVTRNRVLAYSRKQN